MRSEMRATLDQYKRERDEFNIEFNTHKDIIRRYDEILTDKASKHSLYELETKLKHKFKPLIKGVQERVEQNLSLIREQKQYFEAFREMISSEVYSTIKSETRNEIRLHESEMIKAQPQIVGLRTILSEGHGGMLKVLSLKANQEDLDKF